MWVVGRKQREESVQEVVVVYETHENASESDRGEFVPHTCPVEVLYHSQHQNYAQG